MTEKTEKCKHDSGWLVEKNVPIFVTQGGLVEFDCQDGSQGRERLPAQCNARCGATRNLDIKAEVVTWGKVKP